MTTVSESAFVIVPEAWFATHVCHGDVGWLLMVTANDVLLAIRVVNSNEPAAVMARSLPPLFWRTRPAPATPLTVPPTRYVLMLHATDTFVTAAPAIVPEPFATTHVCEGFDGCVLTVTE